MTYIKLLTALTALALLTACGGGGTADSKTAPTATDCEANAFHADCLTNNAPALLLRQTMCLADSTTDDSCGAVIEGVCMDDPFNSNATCTADTYLSARIAECIKGGEADEGKCATITTDTEKNTMVTSCLTNPFDIVCQTSVTDFAIHTATARMNRLDFCNDNANVADGLCTDNGVVNNVVIICNVDPFTAICFTGDTYLSERLDECIMAGNAGDNKCNTLLSDSTMNTAITACLTNPFATACASLDGFTDFALARTNRVSFCETAGNDSNTLCMGANLTNLCGFSAFSPVCTEHPDILDFKVINCLNSGTDSSCAELILVNHGDYLASFGNTPPLATVALATANTAIRSHFLSIGADGVIDRVGLTGTITSDTLSRAGDAMDGVTYVEGTIESVTQSFVGLLPSTNLGAPLPSTTADATWVGSYYMRLNNANHPITFNIDFGAGTIDATDTQASLTTIFDLDFTATGVITGDVSVDDDTAQARGLIGEQGLVGGFANTDGGTRGSSLYGGFVSVPSVATHANFKTYYAARTDNRRLHPDLAEDVSEDPESPAFIVGTATGLPMDGLTFTGNGQFAPFTVRLKEASSGNDGFAIMSGEVTGVGLTRRFRAGLLSGTDLGPAVPTTGMATWAGTIYSSLNLVSEVPRVPASVPLNLTVDFTAGTINTTTDVSFGNSTITVKGRFGSTHSLPDGILGGFVDYTIGNGALRAEDLPLIGLIGTKGVIGVFHGRGQLSGVGGFQASPSE